MKASVPRVLGAFTLCAIVLGLSGCGDDPKPGAINWTVKHHNALMAKTDSLEDLRGNLYACLFKKNPFTNVGTSLVAWQSSCSDTGCQPVDLNAPEAMIDGSSNGMPAFGDVKKGTYVLVLMLDDDDSNALKQCTDDKTGEVIVSDRDPLSVTNNIVVEGGNDEMGNPIVTRVDAVFDHRKRDMI